MRLLGDFDFKGKGESEMATVLVICNQCEKTNRVDTAAATGKEAVCGSCQSPLSFHDFLQDVSETSLAKLIKAADRPVVVDFWAEWCAPCKAFAPTFKAVAQQMSEQFIFAKLNTETYPAASRIYQIRGIPTLIVFQNQGELDRRSGAMPLEEFKRFLSKILARR